MMRVDVSSTREVGPLLRKLAQHLSKERINHIAKGFAEDVHQRLIHGIKEQAFRLAPLSQQYLQQKVAQGYDRRILIRSGDYLNSIQVVPTRTGYVVQVDAEARTDTGLSMRKLAFWLEYGTKRMPARPHWRPTTAWVSQTWSRKMTREINNLVRGP